MLAFEGFAKLTYATCPDTPLIARVTQHSESVTSQIATSGQLSLSTVLVLLYILEPPPTTLWSAGTDEPAQVLVITANRLEHAA
jgi:hypothetical protein